MSSIGHDEALEDAVDLVRNPDLSRFPDPMKELARRMVALVNPHIDADGPVRARLLQQIEEGLRRADITRARWLTQRERDCLVSCLADVRATRGLMGERDEFDPDAWLLKTFFDIGALDHFDDPSIYWPGVFSALLHEESVAVARTSGKARASLEALVRNLDEDGKADAADQFRMAYRGLLH
jgi:hypothetical protein